MDKCKLKPPHLFYAFLDDQDGIVVSLLEKLNVNIIDIKAGLQSMIDKIPKQENLNQGPMGQIMLGPAMLKAFQVAQNVSKNGDQYISVEHIFWLI